MKNLLTPAICILVCILFSSCGSNLSIVKRHYRSGFYVNHSKRVKTSHLPNEEEKTAEANRAITLHTLPYPAKQNIIEGNFEQESKTRSIILVTATDNKAQHKGILHRNIQQLPAQTTGISKSPAFQNEQTFSAGGDYGSPGRAALSLFWIVILVILILWLIGIIAGGLGLGGLINILLVIALVLLILWLLRVV